MATSLISWILSSFSSQSPQESLRYRTRFFLYLRNTLYTVRLSWRGWGKKRKEKNQHKKTRQKEKSAGKIYSKGKIKYDMVKIWSYKLNILTIIKLFRPTDNTLLCFVNRNP